MRLSVKTGLIVTLALVVGFGGTFTTAGLIILDDQERLEEQAARSALDRMEASLERDATELEGTATELLQIMAVLFQSGQNQTEDQSSALGAALFAANDLDFMYIDAVDPATGERVSAGFTLAGGLFADIDPALNASVQASSLVSPNPPQSSGAFSWDGKPYLAASKALVLPGLVEDGGVMVVARALDEGDLVLLAEGSSQHVHFADPGDEFGIRRDGLERVHAWQTVQGPDGDAFAIEVEEPRDLYMRGLMGFLGFLGAAAVMSAGIIVLTLYLLRRFMVERIRVMSRKMMSLQRDDRLSERVRMDGDDELSDMADAFDGLMDTLEKRTKRLDRFASVVSHDLQSPLSTFTLNIALLRRKAEQNGDAKAMEQLDRMERTCQHMQRHIRAVLDYSRDKDAPLEQVDLDALLDEVLEDMAAELGRSEAQVCRTGLPRVQGDPGQIRQVIQNVLQNALKYRKPKEPARVRIMSRRRGDRWHIRILDHGRGFANGHTARMVEPFSRLDNTEGTEGHGVGLSICAELIERHGGQLLIQGRAGVGAYVEFDLPAVPEPAAPRPRARPVSLPQA